MRSGFLVLVCAVLMTACDRTEDLASRDAQCWLDPARENCTRTIETGGWTFTVNPDEGGGNGYFELEVTVPDGFSPEKLLMVWEGETMYMGKLPVPLEPSGNGRWSALVALPACSVDPGMNWIMKVQSASGPVRLEQPLVLGAQPQN